MNDHEIDQIIQATSPPPVPRWIAPFAKRGAWFLTTRMGHWMTGKTARWQTILAVLAVAVIGFPLVINSIGATNSHLREVEQTQTDQQLYTAALLSYANASNTYAVCLASANTFASDRQKWQKLIDGLEASFPGRAGMDTVVQILRDAQGPSDPLTIADCPPPGDPPIAPKDSP